MWPVPQTRRLAVAGGTFRLTYRCEDRHSRGYRGPAIVVGPREVIGVQAGGANRAGCERSWLSF